MLVVLDDPGRGCEYDGATSKHTGATTTTPGGESNYRRPGDEWGTGFRFTGSGCWHIHLTRDDTSGDVWLNI